MEKVIVNCDHRGPLLRITECTACGSRGLPLEVFACDLHGECTLSAKHNKIKSCIGCRDILSVLDPQPLLTRDVHKVRRPKAMPWEGLKKKKYSTNPALCTHPSKPTVHATFDTTQNPPLLMLDVWCRHCGTKYSVEGKTVLEIAPVPFIPANSKLANS